MLEILLTILVWYFLIGLVINNIILALGFGLNAIEPEDSDFPAALCACWFWPSTLIYVLKS